MGIKVTLREKEISKGRLSLYLDYYPAVKLPGKGKPTRREFLRLYVIKKPRTPIDKEDNKATRLIAQGIRQKRHNELNKPEIYTEFEKEKLRIRQLGKKSFIKYFEELARKRRSSNHDNWMSSLNYLKEFAGKDLKFAEVTEKLCNDFKEYLLNAKSKRSQKARLANNSALSYFNKFKATLRQAYHEGLLQSDINAKIKAIKPVETRREFLTLEELQELVKTPCNDDLLKRAALFSALTGLRFSDIQKLVWGEVQEIPGEGYVLRFRQKKTGGEEVLPISGEAFELLGEPLEKDLKVFDGLKYWDSSSNCVC